MKRPIAILILALIVGAVIAMVITASKFTKAINQTFSEKATEKNKLPEEYLSLFDKQKRNEISDTISRNTSQGIISFATVDSTCGMVIFKKNLSLHSNLESVFSIY